MSPELVVFDVNETLSDMAPVASAFEDVGVPGELAAAWFAGVLRDGFALTVAAISEKFSVMAEDALRQVFTGRRLDRSEEEAVRHVMGRFAELGVHPDVPGGVRALRERGLRLVTLSNGSTSVAEKLLDGSGLRDEFEKLLSVEAAGVWKPARAAYTHALDVCGVEPGRALLVAVHPWDVDGALRAGLGAAWLNRSGAPYPRYFRSPDAEVEAELQRLDEFPG